MKRLDSTNHRRSLSGRGFATGIVLSLLVAAGVFAAVRVTEARAGGGTGTIWAELAGSAQPSAGDNNPVWRDGNNAGNTSGTGNTGQGGRYVALGDSVAAGLGLPLVANANAQDQTCGRSSQAYAFEVGRQLGLTPTLLACSGATAGDLITQQHVDGDNPAAQVPAAFAGGQPSLITITAGANDVYWNRYIQQCYGSSCGTDTDNKALAAGLSLMRTKYRLALADIQTRSAANGASTPTVILTGYYNPFSASCAAVQSNVTATELAWLGGARDQLDQAIRDVADSYSFARFADVDFSGHDICSSSPWVQGLAAAAPIHPTEPGQQAIARAVLQAASDN